MKIKMYEKLIRNDKDGWEVPITTGKGPFARRWNIELDPQEVEKSFIKPQSHLLGLNTGTIVYKGYVLFTDEPVAKELTDEEILRTKHFVLQKEKELDKISKEVEAFENFDKSQMAKRERIPDNVRLFVWQRDEGKCVKCGSKEKLEFDHIIPIAEGGSNTERNIQLLCESCNRSKGKNI